MGRHNKPHYIVRDVIASGETAVRPSEPAMPFIDPVGNPRQGALPSAPPFVFRGVTSRVFPLKANMSRLAQFCDRYLNMDIPATMAHFRPSLPYVYLMVLNYGSMAAETVQAQNVGWVSQHEITFTVPLEWWREERGRLVFKDWACVSPFIFVDDELSLTTGREVYGWPKVMGHVDADVPLWTTNPTSGEHLFSLSTQLFPKLYAGRQEVPRVLVEVDRVASPAYSTFPLDPSNPWNPFTMWADAARAWLGMTQDWLEIVFAPRLRGYPEQRSPVTLWDMFGKASGNLVEVLPELFWPWSCRRRGAAQGAARSAQLSIQQITLKQFRDTEDPNAACYQALVSSPMGFDRLNRTGLLGDLNLLRGDPSGGLTVRIHRYPSWPIIECLGLDVVDEYEGSEGVPVAVLKPTLPFWTDVELNYGKGQVICSRTTQCGRQSTSAWVDEQADSQPPHMPAPAATAGKVPYNTAIGAATQAVSGPFTFPDVTLQVFPLLADRLRLTRFVDCYMNDLLRSTDMRFQTCGAYVYMLVSVCDDQLGSMWSSNNNIGWWAEREVSFVVPVKVYYGNELVTLGLLTPFAYASSGRAVISDREVNGRPTIAADIEQPPDVWLMRSGPVAQRKMLRLDTEIFPALNLGQRAEQRTLVEIDAFPLVPNDWHWKWRDIADTWGARMVGELKRKTYEYAARREEVQKAKALSLELLAYGLPFNFINLKQYRDASHIDQACYQAIVQTTRSITRIYDWREIEEQVHVRVHKSPGHPIVDTLGLVVKSTDSNGGAVVDNLQPIQPFWMRIGLREDLGKVIAGRAAPGDDTLTVLGPICAAATAASETTFFRARGKTHVGPDLGQPFGVFQHLYDHARSWLRRSYAYELALIRARLQTQSPRARAALYSRLSLAQRAELERLSTAHRFLEYCDALPSDAVVGLQRALDEAGFDMSLPPLPPDPKLAETIRERDLLKARYRALKTLPEERRTAMELMMTPTQRAELDQLRAAGIDRYCRRRGPAPRAMSATLHEGLTAWAYAPERMQRLTFAEARQTLQQLDEIQLVIESILSDEWENRGDCRRRRAANPKPEQFLPIGSVYGDSAELKPQRDAFERAHGLKRVEGVWCVESPAPKGSGR